MLKNFKSSEMKKNTLSGVSALFLGVSSLMAVDALFSSSVMAMEENRNDKITDAQRDAAAAEKARLEGLLAKAQGPKGAETGQAAKSLYDLTQITPTGKHADVNGFAIGKAHPSGLSNWTLLKEAVQTKIATQASIITAYEGQQRQQPSSNNQGPKEPQDPSSQPPSNPSGQRQKSPAGIPSDTAGEMERSLQNSQKEAADQKIAEWKSQVEQMVTEVGGAQETSTLESISSRFKTLKEGIHETRGDNLDQEEPDFLSQVVVLEELIKTKTEELKQYEKDAVVKARKAQERAQVISEFTKKADEIVNRIPDKLKADAQKQHVGAFDVLKGQLPKNYESDEGIVEVVRGKYEELTSKIEAALEAQQAAALKAQQDAALEAQQAAALKAQQDADKKQAAEQEGLRQEEETKRKQKEDAAEQERLRKKTVEKQEKEAEDVLSRRLAEEKEREAARLQREEGERALQKAPNGKSSSDLQKSNQSSLREEGSEDEEGIGNSQFHSAKSHLSVEEPKGFTAAGPQSAKVGGSYKGSQSLLHLTPSGGQGLPNPTLTQSELFVPQTTSMLKKTIPAEYDSPEVSQMKEVHKGNPSPRPTFFPQRLALTPTLPQGVSQQEIQAVFSKDRESALEKFNQLYGENFGRSIDQTEITVPGDNGGQQQDMTFQNYSTGQRPFSYYSEEVLRIFENVASVTNGLFYTLLNKGLDKQLADSHANSNGEVDFSRIEKLNRIIKTLPETKDFSESWNLYYGDLEFTFKPSEGDEYPEE